MCSQFIFPKPRDWTTFEDITADLLKRKFQTLNLQRFGRSGQTQLGIDIVGPTKMGLLGVQCKHYTGKNIPISKIDTAVTEADKFPLALYELIIATSASRHTKAHSHVLALSESRREQGLWPVSIIFWEDIVELLEHEFPDLLYRHFTKHFPPNSFENVKFSVPKLKRQAVNWPTTSELIHQTASENLGGLERIDPYQLAIGVTTFPEFQFPKSVDIEVRLAQGISEESTQKDFLADMETLRQLRNVISTPDFSQEPLVYLQAGLTTSFLFGWMFRRVAGFSPQFIVGEGLWVTDGLPSIGSGLFEAPPSLLSNDSQEVALVLSLSRHIGAQVHSNINEWLQKPRAIIELKLEGNSIKSAAQALSIAREISWRIKTYIDQWQVKRIHLFAAIPTNLAPLITYNLNAICPIDLYFLDSPRAQYVHAGTITNDLGGSNRGKTK